MKRISSLKWTLIVVIAAAAVLPILIFGLVSANISTRILKDVIDEKNILLSKTLVSRIEEYLNHPHEDLYAIKVFFEETPHDSKITNQFLKRIVENHELYVRIQIADASGVVQNVVPFNEEILHNDISTRSYFRRVKASRAPYWSETFISSQLNEPVVSLSLPLNEGVMTAYVSLKSLIESIKYLDISKDSFVSITDQTATYIAHFDYSKVHERRHDPFYDHFKQKFKGEIITDTVDYEGKEMISHVTFIKQTGWAVGIYQSKEEVQSPIFELYYLLAMGALLLLVLIIWFSQNIVKSIDRTMSKIMDYTGQVSAGKYSMTVEEMNYDEFRKLGQNFRTMANNIEAREIRIKESEQTFRATFDSRAIGATIIDREQNITQTNNKWADIVGYQSDDLLKMPLKNLVDERDKALFSRSMSSLIAGDSDTLRLELRLIHNEGKEVWIELHSSAVRDNGDLLFIVNMAVDITGKKYSDLERAKLVSVIEQSNDYILLTDSNGTIEYVNPAFEKVTGYSRIEAIGQNPRILKSDFHDQRFYKELWDTITSGHVWSGRVTNRHKNGSHIKEYAIIFPILNSEGTISNYASIKHDISEQLRIESQLQQSQKMEAIGTLAGGIAHDFNNIISALTGYSRLAKKRLDNKEKMLHYLDQIDTATHRAGRLVSQILTFSRKSESNTSTVLLYPIVKEAVRFIRASIPSTIQIQQDIEEDGYTLADPTQIHQIIMNLCTNAYQVMRESGGILSITLKKTNLAPYEIPAGFDIKPGNYLYLEISDNGPGIDASIQEKIFEPYFTTKKHGEGTGLGLAVVHGIVSSYNGAIDLVTSKGKGTSFKVYLPECDKKSTQSEIAEEEGVVKGGNEHILVIDDEVQIVNIIRETLKGYGYSVTVFTDSEKAFKVLKDNHDQFDLVLTDLIMPGMTGVQFIERAKQINPNLRSILCSGHTQTMNKEKAVHKGVDGYLEKPFQLEQLARLIRSVLDEKHTK